MSLLVVSYGYEIWYVTGREGNLLRMIESRVLRGAWRRNGAEDNC
jgi:hypothetical protein